MFKKWFAVLVAVLALPIGAYAQQEASIQGVITDTTGAVLPGVTITVTHEASGNTVTGVTDAKGEYRVPVRTGTNKVTVELSGFTTQVRTVDLLVGQQGVVNVQLPTGGVAETITVTGAAPLIDTTQSVVGGNVDSKQIENLPVQGRNFLDFTLLAPGSRANSTGDTPGVAFGQFQLNVDGQQITQNCCSGAGGQPKFGQDAIAEFQYVSQFDATQGRSAGVQVNVISKSGSNTPGGSAAGYFRDSSLIAKDFITNTVLPYSNQQVNGTYGGPIVKDKVHFFFNYEYEREPSTAVFNSTGATSYFNADLQGTRVEKKGDVRLDFQLPGQVHMMVRANNWHNALPIDPAFNAAGATLSPSGVTQTDRYSDQLNADFLKVIGSKAVNETKIGYSGQHWFSRSALADWVGGPDTWAAPRLPGSGTPLLQFTGYSIGTPANIPQRIGQEVSNVRDDFSTSFQLHGRNDVKVGGEYQDYLVWHDWCNGLNGTMSFGVKPPANIANYFPDPMNPATWNLVGLAAEVPPTQYQGEVGPCGFNSPRHIGAAFVQDDWQFAQRLTVNLGYRWDGETGTFANEIALPPFLAANRPNPLWNNGPRFGGAFKLNDKTVIRAGWGIYYSETINQTAHNTRIDAQEYSVISTNTTKNPEFIVNPYLTPGGTLSQGVATVPEALASFCSTQGAVSANCVLRSYASSMVSPYQKIPHSYNTSVGIQRQFGETMSAEADWVWNALRGDRIAGGTNTNTNLIFDPTTGANIAYSPALTAAGAATRAFPEFGVVRVDSPYGQSDYKALQTQFNKRFSHRYQLNFTYALSYANDAQVQALSGVNPVPFQLQNDYAFEVTPAVGDQRHRATASGILQLKYGMQASGTYFYGSGAAEAVACGGDYRNTGLSSVSTRYCSPAAAATASAIAAANGVPLLFESGSTILVRNQLYGAPIHRVDLRLSKNLKLTNKDVFDSRLDLYNAFNHANYGTYNVNAGNSSYGLPAQTPVAIAGQVYSPRTLQFGIHMTF